MAVIFDELRGKDARGGNLHLALPDEILIPVRGDGRPHAQDVEARPRAETPQPRGDVGPGQAVADA